jgi:ribonuclease J
MGVELLVCESTNIEQAGSSPSERSLASSFETIFNNNDGRIFVASFSSNIYRLQQVVSAAERAGRKVALVGRSMLNVFDAARSLGYMQMKQDTLIDISQIDRYDPDRICVLTTGSQGEPMSSLTRMAFSEHRSVEIVAGDNRRTSADPIPGTKNRSTVHQRAVQARRSRDI